MVLGEDNGFVFDVISTILTSGRDVRCQKPSKLEKSAIIACYLPPATISSHVGDVFQVTEQGDGTLVYLPVKSANIFASLAWQKSRLPGRHDQS